MLLFSFLVAGSFSFGKIVAADIDPIALTAARFALASVLLATVLAMTGRLHKAHYRQPQRFFVLGGLFAIYFVLMFQALRLTSSLSTSVIFTTMPLVAAALDRAFFKRASPALVWVALLIGATGAMWVVFEGSWEAFTSFSIGYGELLFFIGTLSHAAYAVLVPRLRRGEPVFATTLGVTVAAALLLWICFWPRISGADWTGLGAYIWATLNYLAVLATLGTFALITFAASRLPSAKVTAYTYLTPFWVVMLDSLLGQEMPSGVMLLGGVPIFFALLLLFVEKS